MYFSTAFDTSVTLCFRGSVKYLGAAGHNGVGWREGSRTLVAIYEAPGTDQRDLIPLAGFAVDRIPNGLKGTVVAEGGSAVPARPGM